MSERSGLSIMSDILELTRRMSEKLEDAQFLVEGVEKRGLLMDEFDALKSGSQEAAAEIERDKTKLDGMRAKILSLNEGIFKALSAFRDNAKKELADSNTQKKVLGYTNNALSSSGSYMDIKK